MIPSNSSLIIASGFDRMELSYLKIWTGNEYHPWALFIDNDKTSETGSKKTEEKGTDLGR